LTTHRLPVCAPQVTGNDQHRRVLHVLRQVVRGLSSTAVARHLLRIAWQRVLSRCLIGSRHVTIVVISSPIALGERLSLRGISDHQPTPALAIAKIGGLERQRQTLALRGITIMA
jgi:hypothetical protein